MSNAFFTGGMNLGERLRAIREGNLPDSLVVIDQIEKAIWLLRFSEHEQVIKLLRDSQELVRKAHEAAWKEEITHASIS